MQSNQSASEPLTENATPEPAASPLCPLMAAGAARHEGECNKNCPFQIKRRIERARSSSKDR